MKKIDLLDMLENMDADGKIELWNLMCSETNSADYRIESASNIDEIFYGAPASDLFDMVYSFNRSAPFFHWRGDGSIESLTYVEAVRLVDCEEILEEIISDPDPYLRAGVLDDDFREALDEYYLGGDDDDE